MSSAKVPSVGVYSAKEIDSEFALQNGFAFVRASDILMAAIESATSHFDNFPDLALSLHLLAQNDDTEVSRANREISIRRKVIATALREKFLNLPTISKLSPITPEILSAISNLPSLAKIIRESISPILLSNDYVLCGRPTTLNFPDTYEISADDTDDHKPVRKAIAKRSFLPQYPQR